MRLETRLDEAQGKEGVSQKLDRADSGPDEGHGEQCQKAPDDVTGLQPLSLFASHSKASGAHRLTGSTGPGDKDGWSSLPFRL